MALVLALVRRTSAFPLINIDGPPPACKEAAPLPQIETMIIPLLILAGTTFVGLAFIFGPLQAVLHTALAAAVLASFWLAFVLASAIA